MTTKEIKTQDKQGLIADMFNAGAHFAHRKALRHPSAKTFVFGIKNGIEIFDLEKTSEKFEAVKNFMRSLGEKGTQVIFVGGKNEAREAIEKGALSIGMPYVAGRWVGGTLSNFEEIKKRTAMLESLISQKEKGELVKYTKKERLLIDREIERLKSLFSGIASMKEIPKVMFVVDPKREFIAVKEAQGKKIPVIGLASSDCNLKDIEHVIPGNDSSVSSIKFFINELVKAYREGKLTFKMTPAPRSVVK